MANDLGPPLRGPTRTLMQRDDGSGFVDITPPEWSGFTRTVRVELTAVQVTRYLEWLVNGTLIQRALPDLSNSEREKLVSGLDDADFADLGVERKTP